MHAQHPAQQQFGSGHSSHLVHRVRRGGGMSEAVCCVVCVYVCKCVYVCVPLSRRQLLDVSLDAVEQALHDMGQGPASHRCRCPANTFIAAPPVDSFVHVSFSQVSKLTQHWGGMQTLGSGSSPDSCAVRALDCCLSVADAARSFDSSFSVASTWDCGAQQHTHIHIPRQGHTHNTHTDTQHDRGTQTHTVRRW